ncbi:hypothetical protein [Agromyces protaetiae]|uniref:hypothetical protein n=1 Tax=Agromyces protaetiae TaxID=2509455 RepID=UPI001FB5DD57|nr:hypothetical protein [Agromyces protaetiae]
MGVLPDALRAPVLAARRRLGASTDALSQLALAEFLASGAYDRSVRGLRARYRARRERFEAVVAERLPDARVSGLAAGIQCLLELPRGVSEARVVAEASARGVRTLGLADYAADGSVGAAAPAIVVGIGAPREHRFEAAIGALADAVDAVASQY